MYDLGKLNNFIKKYYPKIRVFLHAFNIIVIGGKIIIAHSWFNEQPYHIVDNFDTMDDFYEWLDKFEKYILKFETQPEKLYKLFDWLPNDKDKKNLMKMIKKDMNLKNKNTEKEYKIIIETIGNN